MNYFWQKKWKLKIRLYILHNCSHVNMYLETTRQPLAIYLWRTFVSCLRNRPLKTSANFHDFWPLPPSVGSFFLLSVSKFGKFLTPPSLKNADVLNGWSLISFEWKFVSCVYISKTKIGKKIDCRPVSYRDYVKYERTCSFASILFFCFSMMTRCVFLSSEHCDPHPRNSSFCRQNALMYFWSSIAPISPLQWSQWDLNIYQVAFELERIWILTILQFQVIHFALLAEEFCFL